MKAFKLIKLIRQLKHTERMMKRIELHSTKITHFPTALFPCKALALPTTRPVKPPTSHCTSPDCTSPLSFPLAHEGRLVGLGFDCIVGGEASLSLLKLDDVRVLDLAVALEAEARGVVLGGGGGGGG
eukprot:GILI01020899.1.p1 GENE.GILI01020899.1~~GILI01020899.1.p1  ORF type:complete len:127 (+),score=6.96 GILI01020899.1:67-447(+)